MKLHIETKLICKRVSLLKFNAVKT